jgi:hypothetical protein
LSELRSLCHDPRHAFFHARPALLKLTAGPCTITASSLTGICSKMHVDRRAVGAVVVPVGLAFVVITIVVVVIAVMIPIMLTCKLARSVANAPNARASTSVRLVVS